MGKYITKRLLQTMAVLVMVSFFTFFLLRLIPGDPVLRILGEEADPVLYQETKKMFGLDQPPLLQYWNWIKGILRGDLGISYVGYGSVNEILKERVPVTLFLSFLSFLVSAFAGISLGVLTAVKQGRLPDTILTSMANAVSGIPVFWLGIVLIYLFSVRLNVLPLYGFKWPWKDGGKSMILPVLCMSVGSIAGIMRQTRSAMLEVIRQDYIRTAKSKGLKKWRIILVHALKNAFVPINTVLGMRLAGLIGGSIFVEQVFLIPGVGSLLITAVNQSNIPVIQACVLLMAFFGCTANLLIDLMYMAIDPRIRLS